MLDRAIDQVLPRSSPPDGDASPAGQARAWRDGDGTTLIGTIHLVLAVTSLLAVWIDAAVVRNFAPMAWLVFAGFAAHTIVVFLLALRQHPSAGSRIVLWLDILWYAALVYTTGSNNSLFFMFFFFSILLAALRFGFDDGAKITLASAALYSLTALSTLDPASLVQVLLRTVFMLALGTIMAFWGESNLGQKRALALLRDVSRLSNPRFGIERTTYSVMQRCRAYFEAQACIVLTHRPGARAWSMRTVSASGERTATMAIAPGASLPPLLALPPGKAVLYARALPWLRRWSGQYCAFGNGAWHDCEGDTGERVADLLEASAFISAPLRFHDGEGRVFVVGARRSLRKTDALFLCHVLDQVVPVLENIHLLDRLASDAALRERQTISRDLHDSTVQPYIGLAHTLTALRNKATPDNPLYGDISDVAAMAAAVVADLRRFAGGFAQAQPLAEPLVLLALRQHLEQVRSFYGLDMELVLAGDLLVGDRLAGSLFQLVCEGVSNIRKHSAARHGTVRIACSGAVLAIDIENEGAARAPFLPASISQRSAALGGSVRVSAGQAGKTVVHITIPI